MCWGSDPAPPREQAARHTSHFASGVGSCLLAGRKDCVMDRGHIRTTGETWLELTMAINTNSEQRQSQARRSCGPLSRDLAGRRVLPCLVTGYRGPIMSYEPPTGWVEPVEQQYGSPLVYGLFHLRQDCERIRHPYGCGRLASPTAQRVVTSAQRLSIPSGPAQANPPMAP